MKAWDELVADAVLGTERRPPAQPETAGPVHGLLGAIDWTDAELALLSGAAALAIYREAGRRPARDPDPPPTPAAAEARQRCGSPAGARLAAMLAGEHRTLLPEWLRAVDQRRLRVPEEHLPALLDLARWQRDFRELVVAVAGECGHWLATVNPDWTYAAAGTERPEREWATAPRDARPLLLARLRRADADAARAQLQHSWPTESPADRPRLVEALAEGLSMADEPFLEGALDDRRKEVRRAAADLLARLPESRLAGRMADRLRPLVRAEGIRRRLVVDLPEMVDEAMLRDGVLARPPAGEGERMWWLRQLVGAAPLSFWRDLGQPKDIVRLGARSDVAAALLAGWAAAAVAQREAGWADVLWETTGDASLLRALDRSRCEQIATSVVADPRSPVTTAVGVLSACDAPWGLPLSRAVVSLVGRLLADTGSAPDTYRLRDAIPRLAAAVDPAVADEAADALADIGRTGWSARVAAVFVEMISFRREMLEELR